VAETPSTSPTKNQSVDTFAIGAAKVGNRPPGGCVGDSRLALENAGHGVFASQVRSTAHCRPAVGNLPLGKRVDGLN